MRHITTIYLNLFMLMRRWRHMPTINKIRLTNVVYEDGDKRFNDDLFLFDGHNAAIVLENGGGKTVFIHTVLQAILPHTHLGERKIRETLKLDQAPARSEEHTSELQSRGHLVCRLLLEKKKTIDIHN